MIRSFRDRETENVFRREPRTKFGRNVERAALRKLLILHAAESLNDLRVPPGNRLEKLSGDRVPIFPVYGFTLPCVDELL